MSRSLRIIYAGTPDFAVPALLSLHEAGHEIVAVLSQPDRPSGRGQKLKASPVKAAALDLGLSVMQPLSLRKAEIKQELRKLNADVMIVAAYGLILPQSILDMPRLGCLNIHASLLPRWRGAAPIHRAIEAGDKITGITIMQMDAGLDTGDMLSMHPLDINDADTSQTLHDALAQIGALAIVETLQSVSEREIKPLQQNEQLVTYAHKLHKSEARIDWSESAEIIGRKVRAFNPWPGAFTVIDGKSLKVWKAESRSLDALQEELAPIGKVINSCAEGIDIQTGQGVLRLLEIQLAGRKRLPAAQFVNAVDLSGYICEQAGT